MGDKLEGSSCFWQLRGKNKMLDVTFHETEIKRRQRRTGDPRDVRDCEYNCDAKLCVPRPCVGQTPHSRRREVPNTSSALPAVTLLLGDNGEAGTRGLPTLGCLLEPRTHLLVP